MSGLMAFLRRNGRHTLFFPGDWKLPQLNPISSYSRTDSGKPTLYLHEPRWTWRLRQRLFCFAGHQWCGRRGEQRTSDLPDTWDIGPDGNRTCSYCGSNHFDDLMEICRKTLTDERYGVELSTKGYKFYVRQPGVRNASEGAIKYYTPHTPKGYAAENDTLFAKAVCITSERFEKRINAAR